MKYSLSAVVLNTGEQTSPSSAIDAVYRCGVDPQKYELSLHAIAPLTNAGNDNDIKQCGPYVRATSSNSCNPETGVTSE